MITFSDDTFHFSMTYFCTNILNVAFPVTYMYAYFNAVRDQLTYSTTICNKLK